MSENILESGKLYELWAWYESNRKKIHTWAIILTIIGVSIAYVIWSGNQKKINANTALFELGEPISIIAKGEVPAADLLKIAENYSGTSTAERAILEAGAVYFTTGEYQKAYDTFKNFQNSFPTAGPLLSIASYGEAVSLDAMNKVDEAIALYQKLITDNTLVSLQSKINLASLYLAKEQPDKALELYEEISRTPQRVWASDAYAAIREIETAHPELKESEKPENTVSSTPAVTATTNQTSTPAAVPPMLARPDEEKPAASTTTTEATEENQQANEAAQPTAPTETVPAPAVAEEKTQQAEEQQPAAPTAPEKTEEQPAEGN